MCLRAFASKAGVPEYGYDIVHTYPHDPAAFTEGLFYLNGFLYESTGLEGHSSIRKVRLETGEVVRRIDVPDSVLRRRHRQLERPLDPAHLQIAGGICLRPLQVR